MGGIFFYGAMRDPSLDSVRNDSLVSLVIYRTSDECS